MASKNRYRAFRKSLAAKGTGYRDREKNVDFLASQNVLSGISWRGGLSFLWF
jgi:hypothetical protein